MMTPFLSCCLGLLFHADPAATLVPPTPRTAIEVVAEAYPIRVTLVNCGGIVDRVRASASWRALEAHPAWIAAWKKKSAKKGLAAFRFVTGAMQTDIAGFLRIVLARRVALHVAPREGGDALALALFDLGDPSVANEWFTLLDQVTTLIGAEDGAVAEGRIHSVNQREFHAVSGSWLAMSNDRDALATALEALDVAPPVAPDSGASRLEFEFDIARLRKPHEDATPRHGNGVEAIFAHGIATAQRSATRFAGSITFGDDAIRADAVLEHPPIESADLAWYVAPQGAVPPAVWPAGTIATLRLDRRLADFYRAKDSWLAEDSENDFVQFDNGMNLFFGGRSFQDEILPAFGDGALLVVVPQVYAELVRMPAIRIPSFTLLLPVKPGKLKESEIATAFQNTLAIVNLDRAGKGGDSLLAGSSRVGSTTIYEGRFPEPEADDSDPVDVRFNASPAVALDSGHLLLSSAREGLDSIVNALGDTPRPVEARPARTALAVDLQALAMILGENRESFVADRMLKEGEDRPAAEGMIDLFLLLLRTARHLEASVELGEGGHVFAASLDFAAGAQR